MARPDLETLSAYIDNEVSPPFSDAVAQAIETDSVTSHHYNRFRNLQAVLPRVSEEHIEESAARTWRAVQQELHSQRAGAGRTVQVPVFGLAGAAAMVAVLVGALVWSLFARPALPAERLLAENGDVDVTIQLANGEMEQVLSWLADQDLLGEVNIQLPEQQFSIVGEPMLVKPAAYPGDGER